MGSCISKNPRSQMLNTFDVPISGESHHPEYIKKLHQEPDFFPKNKETYPDLR